MRLKSTRQSRGTLLALVVLVGIASAMFWTARTDAQDGPRIPPVFQPFYGGPIFPEERWGAIRDALPYDRISIELSGGMVIPGGHFRLTLLKNGEATLWSAWGGSRLGAAGDFVGVVNLFDLGKLNHLVAQSGFERMVPRYQTGWSDQQTVTIAITAKNKEVSVADYGGAAPIEFWAIQQALEAISHRIRWNAK